MRFNVDSRSPHRLSKLKTEKAMVTQGSPAPSIIRLRVLTQFEIYAEGVG